MKKVVMILSGTPPTLEEAQRVIGGYVELIKLPNKTQMLVDEEGKLKQLPYNEAASRLAGMDIVGNAIVLTGTARWK